MTTPSAATFVVAGLLTSFGCERVEQEHARTAPTSDRVAASAHYTLHVLGVEICRTSGATSPADTTRRVGVDVSIEPTTDVQVPANPYYARLVDEHHQVYEATLGGCGEPLSPALPQRGRPARGYVVFDVPRASRQLSLLYAPELVDLPREEVSIALGL
jgi:hypothetical protein